MQNPRATKGRPYGLDVPNRRLQRWDVGDAVPYGPNHGSFALRRRILRCKIRGRPKVAPTVRISYTVPNCRLRRWDVEGAVPYAPNPIQVRIPYAERKLAIGRAVLLDCHQAKPISHEFGSRPCRATGRAVLLEFRRAEFIRHEFGSRHCRANSREGPMVLFYHQTIRTNCPPALPGGPVMKSRKVSPETGIL